MPPIRSYKRAANVIVVLFSVIIPVQKHKTTNRLMFIDSNNSAVIKKNELMSIIDNVAVR